MKRLLPLTAVLLFLDLLTKWVFSIYNFNILPGIFSIAYTVNTGAAFSILEGMRFLFIAVAIAVITWSFFEYRKSENLAFAFIIAGSLGNLLDRALLGYVRDFISVSIWPVFNFADIFNVVGVGLIIYESFRKKRHASADAL